MTKMERDNPSFQYVQTADRVRKYEEQGYWGRRVFYDYLKKNAGNFPQREGIVDARTRITFGELKTTVDNLAANLMALGVGKNDIICVQVPNRVEYFLMRYALSKIGAVILGLGVGINKRELRHIASLTRARGILAPVAFHRYDYIDIIMGVRDSLGYPEQVFFADSRDVELPTGTHSFERLCEDRPGSDRWSTKNRREYSKGPNEIDMLSLTSGTTGLPKICQFTPNRRMLFGKQIAEFCNLTHEDTMLVVCPIPQGVGNSCSSLAAGYAGAKLVMQDRFDAEKALDLIEREKVTVLVAVPTQTIKMLSLPGFRKYHFDSLRLVISAGSYLPYETGKEIIQRMKVKLVPIFGSHDGGTICMGSLDMDDDTMCRTVGRPLPDAEIKVAGKGNEALPQGEVGEFLYRSANGSAGYYGDLEATKAAWDEAGYFHSGDLGRVTGDGFVEVKGRVKDIIIRGGQNINPEEIEETLIDHPHVENAAIVGMPDPIMGERCCAYVSCKKGKKFTFGQMISFLKERDIATYKLPERLELVDDIPVSEGTKPKKDALKRDILDKLKNEGAIK